MNHSMPDLTVHHQFPESTQTHVHQVGDAIQPSYTLSSPSPLALRLSQHQGLFKWVSSSHQVGKYWSTSFSISPSNGYSVLIPLELTALTSLLSNGLSSLLQHKVWKISSSVFTCFYGPTFTHIHDYWKKHRFDYVDLCWQSDVSTF